MARNLARKRKSVADSGPSITFKFKNTKPVDLLDLTTALAAFGDAYQDHAVTAGFDVERGNLRLYIRKIRSGSIIAELISQADQASFILQHDEVAAAFLANLNDIVQFFLGIKKLADGEKPPTKKEASQIIKVMEPVAKDGGSNLILNVTGGEVHFHQHVYSSVQANAVQNAAARFLGPQIPVTEIKHDALLKLYQVRDDGASASVGDKGIVEEVSPSPVKLHFASEDAKNKVLGEAFPFQNLYLVDVEVKASEGRAVLYRVLLVKEVIAI